MKQHIILLAISTYCILIASVIAGQHLISLFGVPVTTGMFIFPLTYVLIAVMAELFGARITRHVIFCCALANVCMIIVIYAVIQLPSQESSIGSASVYDLFLQRFSFILMVSTVAFTVSETVNVYLLARLKILTKGKYFLQRVFCSSICAITLDTLIVLPFYLTRHLSFDQTFMEASLVWLLKILVEVLVLPVCVVLVNALGKREEHVLPPSALPFTSHFYLKQYD